MMYIPTPYTLLEHETVNVFRYGLSHLYCYLGILPCHQYKPMVLYSLEIRYQLTEIYDFKPKAITIALQQSNIDEHVD